MGIPVFRYFQSILEKNLDFDGIRTKIARLVGEQTEH